MFLEAGKFIFELIAKYGVKRTVAPLLPPALFCIFCFEADEEILRRRS
jgi:hypothetical protein